eukprot:Sro253_g099810.1 Inherit from NOG: DTW domain (275) ;mRNA; r:20116-20940
MQDKLGAASECLGRWKREQCCDKSRFLYCPECCSLLVPPSDRPVGFSKPLPFDIHFILDDRRGSSTGVQLMALFQSMMQEEEEESDNKHSTIQMFDITEHSQDIPPYEENAEYREGTYLLFPGEGSVPLSSVLNNNANDNNKNPLKTLVLMDCKWSRPSSRFHPSIASLPKVSLDHPPEKSYYWRWHNTGAGMLSTVEALFFASWQICSSSSSSIGKWTQDQCQEELVRLLWLFRLQRTIIQTKYDNNEVNRCNPYAPFTEEGKQFSRLLRKQK